MGEFLIATVGEYLLAKHIQGTCICIFSKNEPKEGHLFGISINNNSRTIEKVEFEYVQQDFINKIYPETLYIPLIKPGEKEIMEKVFSNSKTLVTYIDSISQGDLNLTGASSHFSREVSSVRLLRGKHIGRYYIHNDFDEYVEEGFLSEKVEMNKNNTYLVGQEISGTVDKWRLHFALTQNQYKFLFGHTVNKILLKNQSLNYFVLGILNSKLEDWFFRKTSTNNHVMGYELKQLPIPNAKAEDINFISSKVKKIISKAYEGKFKEIVPIAQQIDRQIYKLYELSEAEIKIVES